MAQVKFSILNTLDAFEDSQLRSFLVFSRFCTEKQTDDYLPQLVLSILVQAQGTATLETVTKGLEAFQIDNSEDVAKANLTILLKQNLAKLQGTKYLPITEEEAGNQFFIDLNNKTDKFINSIIAELKTRYNKRLDVDEQDVVKHIQMALSAYYQAAGLSYFKVKNDISIEETNSVLKVATDGLPKQMAELLVNVLGYRIENKTEEEKEFLNTWAYAYLATQVLQVDPLLTCAKALKFGKKKFVLDTDFLLYILTSYGQYSKDYQRLLKQLKQCGCKFYVSKLNIDEVYHHAEAAISRYKMNGYFYETNALDSDLDGQNANIFITDYIRTKKIGKKSDLSFNTYISNYYEREKTVLIERKILRIIGKENLFELPELGEKDQESFTQFANQLQELTPSTKAIRRSDDSNEQFNETDANLYLRILNYNKILEAEHIKDPKEEMPLALLDKEVYLLSEFTKTNVAAAILNRYEYNVISKPLTLAQILNEMGGISADADLINLFENQFLVYAGKQLQRKIDILLKANYDIAGVDIDRLRFDVHTKFEQFLTSDPVKKAHAEQEANKAGYIFSQDRDVLVAQINVMQESRDAALQENERLKKQVADLLKAKQNSQKSDRNILKTKQITKRIIKKG